MKKILNSVIVLAVIAACMIPAGCQKENKVVTLNAKIDNTGSSKVYINNTTPNWVDGDGIFINTSGSYTISSASSNTAVIQNVNESSPYRAVYPASIVTSTDISSSSSVSVTLPRTQYYAETTDGNQVVPVPMGAYLTSGTMLQFHNLCSLVKVNITNSYNSSFTLSGIEIYTETASLSGTGTATVTGSASDIIALDDWSATSSNTNKAVTLSFLNTSNTEIVSGASTITNGASNAKSFYIICPSFSSQDVTIQLLVGGNLFAKFELSNKALNANSIVNVNLVVTANDVIELSDLFSVSANKQVQFSKGNLQYRASDDSWRFAPHQYDVIGAAAGNTTSESSRSTQSAYIDLFNYGTSGYNSTIPPYHLENYYNGTDDIAGTSYDWGVYNNTDLNNTLEDTDPLCADSNSNTWRTLTSAEWIYLLNTRSASTVNGVENVRFSKATVCGKAGLLLFPDIFVWPPSVDKYPPFNNTTATYRTSYDATEWAALEAMNAIFLPTSGHRNEDAASVTNPDIMGLYWSSTTYNSGHAYVMKYKYDASAENDVSVDDRGKKNMGRAVRLVKNAVTTSSSK